MEGKKEAIQYLLVAISFKERKCIDAFFFLLLWQFKILLLSWKKYGEEEENHDFYSVYCKEPQTRVTM